MFVRELITKAQFAAAAAVDVARRVITPPRQGGWQIDATMLESRVLFSASPIDPALVDSVEAPAESIDSTFSFEQSVEDGQADRFNHVDVADASFLESEDALRSDSEPLLFEEAEPPSKEQSQSYELVFVDGAAEDYEKLLDDLLVNSDEHRDLEVYLLDAERDGIEQIRDILEGYNDVDAVHLVSHGSEGKVKLGSTWLSINNLDRYAGDIAGWNDSLRDGSDLLIYGCNLAATDDGQALAQAIGALCDCDVAASDDDTGHAFFGGDWELEYSTGHIETDIAFSEYLRENWGHLLNVTVDATTLDTTPQGDLTDSVNHTTSGADRLMLVGISFGKNEGDSVASVEYNGTPLTFVGARNNLSTNDSRVEIWSLVAPDTGNKSLDVTYTGTSHKGATIGIITFYGVDQATALGSFASGQGDSMNPSATVGSATGELVFGVVAVTHNNDLDLMQGTGQTEYWDLFADEANGAGTTEAGFFSVVTDWTFTGGDKKWAAGGVSIRPVGGIGTVRDSFSSVSYGNNDGSVPWSGNWVESDAQGGGASGGNVKVSSNELRFKTETPSESIYREVDLSTAASATLYYNVKSSLSGDSLIVEISANGGGSWDELITYTSSVTTSETFDITSYASADTQIRFRSLSSGNDSIDFDNIQIEFDPLQAPGGIESNLDLWLRANSGTSTTIDGAPVSSWKDQSTSANDATSASADPTFRDNTTDNINFNPVIDFNNASSEYLSLDGNLLPTSDTPRTYFIVAKPEGIPDPGSAFYHGNSGGGSNWGDYVGFTIDSTTYSLDQGGSDFGVTAGNPPVGIYAARLQNPPANPNTDEYQMFVNHEALTPTLLSGSSRNVTTDPDYAYVGAGNSTGTPANFFNGDIAEIVVYDQALSTADRLRVETYLAVKYGITLNQTVTTHYRASDNSTIWDAGANVAYTNDVAGIGRDAKSSLQQSQSKSINSDAVVTMYDADDQQDLEFLIWGNDDGALTETAVGNPAGVSQRLPRIWTVEENNGEVGTTTIEFDLTGLTYTGTTAADFKLIVDTDTDFTSGAALFGATSYSAVTEVVTFTGIDLDDADFFTLGTDTSSGNIAPALIDTAVTLSSVAEDAGPPVGAVGTLISNIADLNPPAGGQDNVTDPDVGPLTGVAITGADTANGTWYYSTNGGAAWNPLGSVSDGSARILAADANTRIYFQPNADYEGTVAAALTFRAWDRTDGNPNGTPGVDTTINGGSTAYSSATDVAAITVNAVNDEPAGADNTVVTDEDTDHVFAVGEFGFSDALDGDSLLNVIIAAAPTSGTLYNDADLDGMVDGGESLAATDTVSAANITAGRLKFKPVADDNGVGYDSFMFHVQDDGGTANGGIDTDATANTMTIDVTAVNDSPTVAVNAGTTVLEASTGNIITTAMLNEGDPDDAGAGLTYTITSVTGNGTLRRGGTPLGVSDTFTQFDIDTSQITYDHDGSETLSDSFDFSLADGGEDGATAATGTFNITVTPVNDEESLDTNLGLTLPNSATSIITTAQLETTDVDNTPTQLTYTITSVTINGTVKLGVTALGLFDTFTQDDVDNNLVTYQHDGSPTISDSFDFDVDDGLGTNSSGTFNITIAANTEETLTTNLPLGLNEGASATVSTALLQTTDVEQAPAQLTYTLTSVPGNGTLRLSGTPLNASDTFTQDDIDNNFLTYDHDGSETTTDSFDFDVDDGFGGVSSGTFNFNITAINDSPMIAVNTGSTVNEGSAGNIITTAMLDGGDPDDAATGLTYSVTSMTTNGTLRLSGTALNVSDTFTQDDIDNNRITYDHDGSETVSDSFDFSLADGGEDGATAAIGTFNMTVTPVNDEEVLATNTGSTVNEASSGNVIATAMLETTDFDNTTAQLTYTVTTATGNGTLRLSGTALGVSDTFTQADIDGGLVTYDHNGSETVSDSFGFDVDDGAGTNSSGTFNITVTADNTEEVLSTNLPLGLSEGASATVTTALLETADAEQSPAQLVYTVTGVAANGTLRFLGTPLNASDTFTQDDIDNSRITYDHDGGETTLDSFTFTVDDGFGTNTNGSFSINITPVNDPPIGNAESYSVIMDNPLTVAAAGVLSNDGDAEGTPLDAVWISGPANGTLVLNLDGSFNYTPNAGFSGSDSFTYAAYDGSLSSNPVVVQITVSPFVAPPPVNPAPSPPPAADPTPDPTADAGPLPVHPPIIVGDIPDNGDPSSTPRPDIRPGPVPVVPTLELELPLPIEEPPAQPIVPPTYKGGAIQRPEQNDSRLTENFSFQTEAASYWNDLDELREQMQADAEIPDFVIGSAAGFSTAISAGYVVWLIRGGHILAGLMAQLPAWQLIDPLPILAELERDDEEDDDDDSLESLVDTERDETHDRPEIKQGESSPINRQRKPTMRMNDK